MWRCSILAHSDICCIEFEFSFVCAESIKHVCLKAKINLMCISLNSRRTAPLVCLPDFRTNTLLKMYHIVHKLVHKRYCPHRFSAYSLRVQRPFLVLSLYFTLIFILYRFGNYISWFLIDSAQFIHLKLRCCFLNRQFFKSIHQSIAHIQFHQDAHWPKRK